MCAVNEGQIEWRGSGLIGPDEAAGDDENIMKRDIDMFTVIKGKHTCLLSDR